MRDTLVFCGATAMAACACGTASGVASIATRWGWAADSSVIYPILVGTGAVMFLAGIGTRAHARLIASLGIAALAMSILLAPQGMMHGSHTFTAPTFAGFGLYFVAAGLLVWSALRAYGPVREAPAAVALSGLVLATGCTCCLTAGSAHFVGISVGIDPQSWVLSRLFFLSIGVMLAAAGSIWAGRPRAIAFTLAGAVIAYAGEIWIEQLVPAWDVDGMNLVFLLRYPMWLLGAGLLVAGASRALFAEAVATHDLRRVPRAAAEMSA
ncbi:MAG TPA: hypothetical protein VNR64_04360 [Vicinamibacterales bacterium]|nr:hypothetical protein [Vicinamibacterales bacterium]